MSSNLIKGVRAYINQDDVRTIDSDRNEKFRPLSVISTREYIDEEAVEEEENSAPEAEEEEELHLSAELEQILKEERELIAKEAEQIIADAKLNAEIILKEAAAKSEKMKSEALIGGKELGYQQGMEEATAEFKQAKEELAALKQRMEQEYQDAWEQMEPKMAQILIGLVKNLTGVILENKDSVIWHLVGRAMGRITRNDQFIIHVGREDAAVLQPRTALLEKIVGKGKKIVLMEEEDFVKGQCRIETDDQIIDCGIDTQMDNLFESILLLSKV